MAIILHVSTHQNEEWNVQTLQYTLFALHKCGQHPLNKVICGKIAEYATEIMLNNNIAFILGFLVF